MTTRERLASILVKHYRCDPQRLVPERPFAELNIDSLGMTELMFFIEEEFGVELPYEPVPLHTLGDAERYIEGLIASRPQSAASGAPPS